VLTIPSIFVTHAKNDDIGVGIICMIAVVGCVSDLPFLFCDLLTAVGSAEGADENFPVWDVFKEFLKSRSVLHGFG
jgi:hypothetical protein